MHIPYTKLQKGHLFLQFFNNLHHSILHLTSSSYRSIFGGRNLKRNTMEELENVESKIITLRNQQVILDCDVAELYGVQTKRINEAVNNNPEKFPNGYVLRLNEKEKDELVENFDRFNSQKHSSATLKAFTEKGLYMLATILKSPQAVQTTIAIVEAYAKLRELARVVVEIPQAEEDGPLFAQVFERGIEQIDSVVNQQPAVVA